MDVDEQLLYLDNCNEVTGTTNPMIGLDDGDDSAAVDSRVSVVSSEWGNVSLSSSSEHELAAKDIVNWCEFWDIWSSHHRVIAVDVGNIPPNHPLAQFVYSVFHLAYIIPCSQFYMHPAKHSQLPHTLQNYLSQAAKADSTLLGDFESSSPQVGEGNGLALAAIALEIHEAALRLANDVKDALSDEQWTAQLHDALIIRCAGGRLLGPSEAWSQPSLHQSNPHTDSSPTATRILSVRKVRPRGAVPVLTRGELYTAQTHGAMPSFFAAAFSSRVQITSQLRDTPESKALHSYSIMATKAALTRMAAFGIDMPVFGVMFDRHIVRFHADWNIVGQDNSYTEQVSVPLPQAESLSHLSSGLSPFRDFDLTQPDDALRVAFILNAIQSYAQVCLAPAVLPLLGTLEDSIPNGSPLAQDEISSEEKVQAWMQSGAVDAVGED